MSAGPIELATMLIGRAARMERAIGSSLAGSGLSASHWLVVNLLRNNDSGLTMSELAAASGQPPASLTRQVDRLVDNTLVHRILDGSDRRRVLVRLTDRGRAQHDDLAPAVAAAIEAELAGLQDWERQTVHGMLARPSPH